MYALQFVCRSIHLVVVLVASTSWLSWITTNLFGSCFQWLWRYTFKYSGSLVSLKSLHTVFHNCFFINNVQVYQVLCATYLLKVFVFIVSNCIVFWFAHLCWWVTLNICLSGPCCPFVYFLKTSPLLIKKRADYWIGWDVEICCML